MYADLKEWPLESVQEAMRLTRTDAGTDIEMLLTTVGLDLTQQARLLENAELTPVTLTLKAGASIRTKSGPMWSEG